MKQLYERDDIILEIEYEAGPVFISARVLDSNYRATGPNLLSFLDKCYLETKAGVNAEASKFFSLVADELA